MRVKLHFLLFALVVAGTIGGYMALRQGMLPVVLPGKAAESLPAITFYDKSDAPVTLDQFKGKAVLVNLWATWCPPCVHELPALDRLQEKMGGKLAVVALSVDTSSSAELEAFLTAKGVKTLAVYSDRDKQVPLKWKYDGLPTSYLIDKNGNILRRYEGPYAWDQDEMLKEIGAALN